MPWKKPHLFQRKAGLIVTISLGILATLLFWLLVPLNCGCGNGTCSSNLSTLKDLWNGAKPYAHVAHALGEIDGILYTDSRDAFLLSYERGFRTFEVDLVLLQDGSAFCAHDGAEWMYGLDKPFIETTAAELSGRLCLGRYAPLTGSDLLDLIDEYTDACFLLDAKRTAQDSNREILKALVSEAKERHPSVLDRMIPHTFGPRDLCEVAQIYPFRYYWVAVYSHTRSADKDSDTDEKRIVLYVISSGGPLNLLAMVEEPASVFRSWSRIAVPSPLPCLPFGPVTSLSDVKVYVSMDVMESGSSP